MVIYTRIFLYISVILTLSIIIENSVYSQNTQKNITDPSSDKISISGLDSKTDLLHSDLKLYQQFKERASYTLWTPPSKKRIPHYPTIQLKDLSTIHIDDLIARDIVIRDWEHRNYYSIQGTNQVLVIFSGKELIEQFHQWQNRQ